MEDQGHLLQTMRDGVGRMGMGKMDREWQGVQMDLWQREGNHPDLIIRRSRWDRP